MTTYRPFRLTDLFNFNSVNLDHFTETYPASYYYTYITTYPALCTVATAPHTTNSQVTGYMIGKAEGTNTNWHGHITALSVASTYRQLGLARTLTLQLHHTCTHLYDNYFVDLYVRLTNVNAISMYKQLGYTAYRQVLNYYGKVEHAYDMRLALDRDKDKVSQRPHDPFKVQPSDIDQG